MARRGRLGEAHRAGEAIAEVVLAMRNNKTVAYLAGTIHAYPTYSSGLQLLASEMAVKQNLSGPVGVLLRAAVRFMR